MKTKYIARVSYTRGGSFGSNPGGSTIGSFSPTNCNRPSTVTGFRTILNNKELHTQSVTPP